MAANDAAHTTDTVIGDAEAGKIMRGEVGTDSGMATSGGNEARVGGSAFPRRLHAEGVEGVEVALLDPTLGQLCERFELHAPLPRVRLDANPARRGLTSVVQECGETQVRISVGGKPRNNVETMPPAVAIMVVVELVEVTHRIKRR